MNNKYPYHRIEYEAEFENRNWEDIDRRSPDYIRWVQRSLSRILGISLAADGRAGRQTHNAIRRFQQQVGLPVDGVAGPRTEQALRAAGAGSPPSQVQQPTVSTAPPDIVSVRGIQVARQIAPKIAALLTSAETDGIHLSGGGYRSMEKQIELRRQHCGPTQYDIWEKKSSQCRPPTARPGHSMHERGLAIDFTYNGRIINSHDNPGFKWLERNAAQFGLHNLPSEPWHWSVNGN